MRLGTCAINLSGASIEDEGLADFILARITEYAVPPQALCFEITETVAVRNLLKVVGVIERLRRVDFCAVVESPDELEAHLQRRLDELGLTWNASSS